MSFQLDFVFQNHFPPSERSRYSDPAQQQQYQYDNLSYQQDKYDLSRSIGRRYMEPLKGDSESDWNRKSPNSKSDSSSRSAHMYRGNDARRTPSVLSNELSNPWREHDTVDSVIKIDRPHFRLPNKPSLLKKLSDSSYNAEAIDVVDSPDHNPHSPSASFSTEELRSQLPWSYFQSRDDVLKPRKTFSELREDEELPPVPVPDYTLHFPRKDRTVSSASTHVPSKMNNKSNKTNRKKSNSTHLDNEGRE